jgi:MarR family transcriptional regulator, organic hydroperoxide resistance regulator
VEQTQSLAVEQTVVAYREYWTAMLQMAEPFWFQLDLTITQLKGLVVLEVRKEITVGGIAEALGVGRPSASILVEQLVQAKLATRAEDPADRRRSIVCLTDEGRDLAARLHRGEEQSMGALFARLQADELAALTQGLNALTQAMVAARPRPDPDAAHPRSSP